MMMGDGKTLGIGQNKTPFFQQRHRPIPMPGMPPIDLPQIMEERHYGNRIVRESPPKTILHEIIYLNGMLRKSTIPPMMSPGPTRKIPHRLEFVDDNIHPGPVSGAEDGEDADAEGHGVITPPQPSHPFQERNNR